MEKHTSDKHGNTSYHRAITMALDSFASETVCNYFGIIRFFARAHQLSSTLDSPIDYFYLIVTTLYINP